MTTIPAIPQVALNDGHTVPQLGFGAYKITGDQAPTLFGSALDAGYRHIDTAAMYNNERDIGRAIASSGIPRGELFLTTKLWSDSHGRSGAHAAITASLDALGTDYVDLYLIHWPRPDLDLYLETWLALEEICESGRARSIGVSNFSVEQLERIITGSSTVPAVNQIELHPAFAQHEMRAYARAHGIRIESWSPLGAGKYDLLTDPVVTDVASAHGVSAAQAVIRWHLQNDLVVIPRSSSPERMRQNIDVFGFELTPREMAALDALDRGMRLGGDPETARF